MTQDWNPPNPADLLEVIENLLGMIARREGEIAALKTRITPTDLVLDIEALSAPRLNDQAVLILSTSDTIRETLHQLLQRAGVALIAEAADLTEAQANIALHRPAAVILDCEESGEAHPAWIQAIRRSEPESCIVAYLPTYEPQDLRQAAMSGASEVFVKPIDTVRLLQALDQAVNPV